MAEEGQAKAPLLRIIGQLEGPSTGKSPCLIHYGLVQPELLAEEVINYGSRGRSNHQGENAQHDCYIIEVAEQWNEDPGCGETASLDKKSAEGGVHIQLGLARRLASLQHDEHLEVPEVRWPIDLLGCNRRSLLAAAIGRQT